MTTLLTVLLRINQKCLFFVLILLICQQHTIPRCSSSITQKCRHCSYRKVCWLVQIELGTLIFHLGSCAPEQASHTVKWRETYNVLSAYALGTSICVMAPKAALISLPTPLILLWKPLQSTSPVGRDKKKERWAVSVQHLYVYSMHMWISDLFAHTWQCVFTSLLQRRMHANPALLRPCEFTSMY